MNKNAIETFLESVIAEFKKKIDKTDFSASQTYGELLRNTPDIIKDQAKASLQVLTQGTGLSLLVAVCFSQRFLNHMQDLSCHFNLCSSTEKIRLSQLQLAPFQINLLAKQLAIAPGIIKQYEDSTKNNS